MTGQKLISQGWSKQSAGFLPPEVNADVWDLHIVGSLALGICQAPEGAYVISGTRLLGKRYNSITHLQVADKKPFYIAYLDNKAFIVLDAKEYGPYDGVLEIFFADGKPGGIVQENGKEFVVWGETRYGPYDEVKGPVLFAAGNLAYVIRRNNKESAVWGSEESESYDKVFPPRLENNQIVFAARSLRRFYRVSRQIQAEERKP